MKTWTCTRCGASWVRGKPMFRCPACNSRHWRKPRVNRLWLGERAALYTPGCRGGARAQALARLRKHVARTKREAEARVQAREKAKRIASGRASLRELVEEG